MREQLAILLFALRLNKNRLVSILSHSFFAEHEKNRKIILRAMKDA